MPAFLRSRTRAKGSTAALLALVVLAGAVPGHAQEVQLRWQFQEGEELTYRQTQTSHTTGAMGDVTQTQETVMRQDILRVAGDGAADLRVTYEAIRTVQEGPMGRQEFDSRTDDEPDEPGAAIMARLVGTTFEMTMGPGGEIRAVSGLAEVLETMLEAATAEAPPQAAGQVRDMLEGMFGEERMEAMMQQGMHVLPADAVAPGAEWSHDLELTLPIGIASSTYTYRLDDVVEEGGRTIAKLGLTGTLGAIEPPPDNPMAGMLEVSGGDISGTVDFDVDRGVMLRASTSTVMSMSTMGRDMEVESTQEMELVEG